MKDFFRELKLNDLLGEEDSPIISLFNEIFSDVGFVKYDNLFGDNEISYICYNDKGEWIFFYNESKKIYYGHGIYYDTNFNLKYWNRFKELEYHHNEISDDGVVEYIISYLFQSRLNFDLNIQPKPFTNKYMIRNVENHLKMILHDQKRINLYW